MSLVLGDYVDWRHIEYRPPVEMLPHALLPHLRPNATLLDVGCHSGAVACFLAQEGASVLGIDINAEAIVRARRRAVASGLDNRAQFMEIDVLEEKALGTFDAVLLIRVLTCFATRTSWCRLLRRAYSLVKEGGLLYVRDFVHTPDNPIYRERYAQGAALGWRSGNFAVHDAGGQLLFVAHHHPNPEIHEIVRPYELLGLEYLPSLSMNGNECLTFEFMGRRLQTAAELLEWGDVKPVSADHSGSSRRCCMARCHT